MGRRPIRGERAKPLKWETLRFREELVAKPIFSKGREGGFEERRLESSFSGGSAQEVRKAQESKGPDPS
jgi:hypothetical protein